jgi:hypothetical protein
MSLLAYPDAPGFAAGVDMQTTDGIATLWDAARILDLASLAPRDLFCGHASHRHEHIAENPLRYAAAGFRYRTGLTTFTVTLDGTGWVTVNPRLRVAVNGAVRIDSAISSGIASYTATGMAGWGLSDGQVAEVAMEIYDPDSPAQLTGTSLSWGAIYLVDAYVSPASAVLSAAWPGTPAFVAAPLPGNGPTEAGLLQLSAAADWIARRLSVVPQPLFRAIHGVADGTPWWTPEPNEPPRHLWSGGLVRGSYDRLRGRVVYVPGSGTSQRIRLRINGSEVATTPTFSASSSWGATDFDVNIAGYSATASLRVDLEYVVTGADAGGYPPRWAMPHMEAHRAAPTFATLTNRPAPDESTTWLVRRGRLNEIATALSTIKSRIDSNPDRWDRIRLFRGPYGYDAGQAQYFRDRHQAVRRFRAGTRLIVRGSNLKLGWGPSSFTLRNDKEPFGEYAWEWASSETLASGSTVETNEVMLGALPGLEPGFQYVVYGGDVRYAAEELR